MSSESQGHTGTCMWKGLDLRDNVCEYEVNRFTNEKVIRGKQNFNANCLRRWTIPHPPGQIHQSISRNLSSKNSKIISQVKHTKTYLMSLPVFNTFLYKSSKELENPLEKQTILLALVH